MCAYNNNTSVATLLPKIHYGALSGVPPTYREVKINQKFPCNMYTRMITHTA